MKRKREREREKLHREQKGILSHSVYLSIIIISSTCNRKSTFGFHCVCHLQRVRRERCGGWGFLASEAKLDE